MITSTKSSSNVLKLKEVVANGELLFSAVNVDLQADEVLESMLLKWRECSSPPMANCSSDYVDEVLKQCPQVERGRCQWRGALLRRQRERLRPRSPQAMSSS